MELVKNSAVVEVSSIPRVVSPLSVSISSSGKKRLILDLRHVNQSVWKQKIKFEDWRVFRTYVNKGEFLFSFDLKSGYHHVDIFPPHQTYLGFSWVFNGVTKYFYFTVLPFGLTSAPYIFTKLMRPLVKFWRFNGIKIVVYIDDGCGAAHPLEVATAQSQTVRYSLRDAGFVVNSTKSIWAPVQSLIWLGLEWDLALGQFRIALKRINRFLAVVDHFLCSAPYVTARERAVITGHISSMSPVVGNLARLKTRQLYKVIAAQSSWSSKFNIGLYNEALAELFYWKDHIKLLNVQHMFAYTTPGVLVSSDASDVACGGVIAGTSLVCHCMWNKDQSNQSSTWRELTTIQYSLISFKELLAGQTVVCHSDNQAAVRIIEIGSPQPGLQKIALEIFSFCHENNITFSPEWVPRSLNIDADIISKSVDYDDWTTTREFFTHLDVVWGPHTVDRFASHKNAQLVRFNSRYFVPGTETVDAFSVSWAGENNWLVPPIYCVTKVIQHLVASKANGTLIVPYWPSSPFWPFLFINGQCCQPYVVDLFVFPSSLGIFALGDYKDSLIGSNKFKSEVLAARF